MDAGATETMWSPLVLALIGIAIAACIFGMISMVRAWRVSASHPPFAALGWKRWLIGAALPYMPEAATVHVKRHFFSVLTMAACLLALIVILWSGRAY